MEAADCSAVRFWLVPHCLCLVYKIKPNFFFFLADFIPPGVSNALCPKPVQPFLFIFQI